MTPSARHIELLAPARDAGVAIDAIDHGADAVYMGAMRFGARAAAGNTVNDIARVCDYAHAFNARVYATVNTIVYDDELMAVELLVKELYNAGVDALIVQDMALLRLDLPPIPLHASTQCDIRTPEKARFLQDVGFSQLVLARELTLNEIARIHAAVDVPLEAFVHGALCVSYSGRCQVSRLVKGRSANRGECAQLCRLPYDLVDDQGMVIVHGKHLLSLRDMNHSNDIESMLAAGVSSFKIEGRLKDSRYVKNVVAYYRHRIDRVIAASEGRYVRASMGTSEFTFTPQLNKSFNRSFTDYFLDERHPRHKHMANIDTPKSMGEPVGEVKQVRGNVLQVDSQVEMHNGDGLSFFDPATSEYTGVRVNRADGHRLLLRDAVNVRPGTQLYRTTDKLMDDVLSRRSAERTIAVDAKLEYSQGRLTLQLTDEQGLTVEKSIAVELQAAQADQAERQLMTLAKLGGTGYKLRHAVVVGQQFVPASVLTSLRREVVETLRTEQRSQYRREQRRAEDGRAVYPSQHLVSADNVANRLSQQFYRDHGVETIVPAVEVSGEPTHAMHTRYCLRRELGACLLDAHAQRRLPSKLFLRSGDFTMSVHCDCARCEMHLEIVKP